jgi:hypothetical protein
MQHTAELAINFQFNPDFLSGYLPPELPGQGHAMHSADVQLMHQLMAEMEHEIALELLDAQQSEALETTPLSAAIATDAARSSSSSSVRSRLEQQEPLDHGDPAAAVQIALLQNQILESSTIKESSGTISGTITAATTSSSTSSSGRQSNPAPSAGNLMLSSNLPAMDRLAVPAAPMRPVAATALPSLSAAAAADTGATQGSETMTAHGSAASAPGAVAGTHASRQDHSHRGSEPLEAWPYTSVPEDHDIVAEPLQGAAGCQQTADAPQLQDAIDSGTVLDDGLRSSHAAKFSTSDTPGARQRRLQQPCTAQTDVATTLKPRPARLWHALPAVALVLLVLLAMLIMFRVVL